MFPRSLSHFLGVGFGTDAFFTPILPTDVLKQQGHFFDVNSLAYAPDGQLIATSGDDGKVKLWNTFNGFCFVTFDDHDAPVSVGYHQGGWGSVSV